MKASGKMIFNMVKEKSPGLIIQNMMVSIWQERSMDKALISGMMDQNIKVNGLRIRSRVMVLILGLMAVCSKVNGSTTTWTEWASTLGKMEDVIWASIKMTRNMVTESINGLMAGCT